LPTVSARAAVSELASIVAPISAARASG
jgi:hypothetical protein